MPQSHMPMAVLAFVAVVRCWQALTPAITAWRLAYLAALLAVAARQGARPASFARRREVTALLLRLASFGGGLGWVLSCRFLDGLDVSARPTLLPQAAALLPQLTAGRGPGGTLLELLPAAASAASHVAILAFASGAVCMVYSWHSMRARLSLSVAAQAALAASALPFDRSICGSKALASPPARAASRRIFYGLSLLRFCLPVSMGRPVALSAADECVAVVAFLQWGAGALVPLLVQAVSEARLFQLHQLQRRRGGMPLECGWHVAAYDAIWRATAGGSALHLYIVCALLAMCCWDLCVLFTASLL